MSLNDLAVDLTCEPQEISLDHVTQANPPPSSPFPGDDPYRDGHSSIDIEDVLESIPGSFPGFLDNTNTVSEPSPSTSCLSISGDSYQVHGGIHKMAIEMGSVGRPVWLMVNDALKRNRTYELILCGHSLGAGLCTMFGLVTFSLRYFAPPPNNTNLQMWADPGTCRTVRRGGLPIGRGVRVYAFAPPYVFYAVHRQFLSGSFPDVF